MNTRLCIGMTAIILAAGSASAGFAGQTILGPLTAGSVVNGDTTGHADDNDGFFSGDHIFDIWDGGDDAWKLNWAGGDLTVTLTYNNQVSELDLFVYSPGSLDDAGADYDAGSSNVSIVAMGTVPAGEYYIVVDSEAGFEGAYQLAVSPTPGAGMLLGASGLLAIRRRRN